jgi:hypothetical protein
MTPSLFHVPPRPFGALHNSSTAAPDAFTRFSPYISRIYSKKPPFMA